MNSSTHPPCSRFLHNSSAASSPTVFGCSNFIPTALPAIKHPSTVSAHTKIPDAPPNASLSLSRTASISITDASTPLETRYAVAASRISRARNAGTPDTYARPRTARTAPRVSIVTGRSGPGTGGRANSTSPPPLGQYPRLRTSKCGSSPSLRRNGSRTTLV